MKSIFDVFMEVIFDAFFFFLKAASDNDFIFFNIHNSQESLIPCRDVGPTQIMFGKKNLQLALCGVINVSAIIIGQIATHFCSGHRLPTGKERCFRFETVAADDDAMMRFCFLYIDPARATAHLR